MKYSIEKKIRHTFNALGLDLHRLRPEITLVNDLIKSFKHFNIDTVLDVGANVGQFATSLRQVGYCGRIISFEPLSEAYALLCQRAINDPLWDIYTRCAIGDYNGETKINISANSESSSILDMMEEHSNAAPKSVYIGTESSPIYTLDFVTSKIINKTRETFLKIDTQGFEWEVLDGAVDTLQNIRGILLEVSLIELYEGQRLWKEVVQRIEKEGFEIWAIKQAFSDPKTGRILQYDIAFFKS